MFKKTMSKAIIGTAAAGAMMLPAAATISPSLQLVACQYPNSITSATDVQIPDPLVRPGEAVQVNVFVHTEDNVNPRGDVTVTITGPNGKRVRTKEKPVSDGNIQFQFNGFKLGKKRDGKTMKVTARFNGGCRFQNSSGSGYFVVSRG